MAAPSIPQSSSHGSSLPSSHFQTHRRRWRSNTTSRLDLGELSRGKGYGSQKYFVLIVVTGAKRRRQGACPPLAGAGKSLCPRLRIPPPPPAFAEAPAGLPAEAMRRLASQGGCGQRKGQIKNHFSSSGWRTSTKGHGILPTGRGLTWSLVRNDGITQPYLVDEPLSLTLPLSHKVLFFGPRQNLSQRINFSSPISGDNPVDISKLMLA